MRRPRILIADDHEITRIGVRATVDKCGAYEVCGEAADGRAAVEMTCRLKPDVLVLDIGLPFLNGLEVARRISVLSPQTSILVFTEIDAEHIMLESLRNGAKGFMLKSEGVNELLAAIEAVRRGHTRFNARISQMLLNLLKQQGRDNVLSGREREVTQLVAEGYCTREIAETLVMSAKTVETHRSNIMRKLSIHTTAELTLYAVRNDLVLIERPPQIVSIEGRVAEAPEPIYVESAAAA
jgi:DNA-binding NarL/FixJ family response regulator